MTKSGQLLYDCLLNKTTQCEDMTEIFRNIFTNTINKNFEHDFVYKFNILANIKQAVGKNLYEQWIEIYEER